MGKKDERVDGYIEKAEPFARPILTHLREVVHEACPDVEETIKWGMPFFEYEGILCHIASFKEHCAFGFWKGSLVLDEADRSDEAMGNFGRITSMEDVPSEDELVTYIKKAMSLNEEGIQPKKKKPKPVPATPKDFEEALGPEGVKRFEAMPPSHRREYVEWIEGAKQEATRKRRIKKGVAQIAEGKSLNWKYE